MADERPISADFPFESHFIEVHGSRMHYVDEGEGDPILLLHGNPTSSYLWRNIIPHLTSRGRCIAPDLIGMGRSDKPDLGYRFFDHVRYLEGFIEALELRNVTLVVHDWGSGLGLHYAARHEDNVAGIAMMEAILTPMHWSEFPADFRRGFKMFRAPGVGALMIQGMNAFLTKMMPNTIVRDLTAAEMAAYHEPFPSWSSRKPLRVWPLEIPIDGDPADVHEAVSAYHDWLQRTEIPKLLLYAHPGGIVREGTVAWAKESLPNLETVDLGEGVHYLQEDHPHEIGEAVAGWMDAD